ncbi:hypothetical protein QBC43DRAFT_45733 [Cladorrhinum sp. PSN259]|nr:hypothetical protein QBC43DRAFT_45733 [Cladorrhinum sp. PSN259]
MASRLIELSCQRFRRSIEVDDDRELQRLSLEDVRQGVFDIQRELRAKQCLRNLDRLSPYLDAADRYSKAVGHLCNGVPFLPYIWAPLMVILRSVRDQTHALDRILSAYAQIGNALPQLARYEEAFRGNRDFEHLLAFLFQDIAEFQIKALTLIRKPAWKIFFVSSWGRFESRFGAILESIAKTSSLIDKEVASLNIVEMREWRQDSLEKAKAAENKWESEQFQALMKWLQTSDKEHQSRYDWLRDRVCEGTGAWITTHPKFRSWMRQGSSSTGTLWMNGKPGSGKSVLCSQIVKFLQTGKGRLVLFIFVTRQTHLSAYDIQTHILQAIVAQIVRLSSDMVPLLYDKYLAKAQTSSASVLKGLLAEVLPNFEEIRLVVDGVDELPATEHKSVIKDLLELAKKANGSLKILISSQDLPSIRPWLGAKPTLPLSHERDFIMRDIQILVQSSMEDLDESFGGGLPEQLRDELTSQILEKADGMILWVHLVFSLLRFSSSIRELRSCIEGVPQDLKALYGQILNNIAARCSSVQLARVKRVFGWLIFSKDGVRTKKTDVLIGSTLCEGTEILDRDTRPFPTSLDVCKPLIEDGPHGTVTIVHSTVTEHILSDDSGPFIDEAEAHHSLAYACVSQVTRDLDLVLAADQNQCLLHVCEGLFGLHDYADEYWTQHVVDAMGLSTTVQGYRGRVILTQQITLLCHKHANASSKLIISHSAGTDLDIVELSRHQNTHAVDSLDVVSHIPELKALLTETLSTRTLQEDDFVSVDAAPPLQPSAFRTADEKYRQLVRQLIEEDNQGSLPAEEILAFRQQYATSAYPCPHRGCTRRRFGFLSSKELDDHLVTTHSPGFKCYQQGCGYNDVGFPSRASLQAHVRNHHNPVRQRALPRTVRRGQSSFSTFQQATNAISNSPTETEVTVTLKKGAERDRLRQTTEKSPAPNTVRHSVQEFDTESSPLHERFERFNREFDKYFQENVGTAFLFLIHKLERTLLLPDQPPVPDDMFIILECLIKLEQFLETPMITVYIKSTKICDVLKAILRLNQIPKDSEFHIRQRSQTLLDMFEGMMSSGKPAVGMSILEEAENGEPQTPKNHVPSTTLSSALEAASSKIQGEYSSVEDAVDSQRRKITSVLSSLSHKLPTGMLRPDDPQKEPDDPRKEAVMSQMSQYIETLEGMVNVEAHNIRSPGINIMMERIPRLNIRPKDDKFRLKSRVRVLLEKYKRVLEAESARRITGNKHGEKQLVLFATQKSAKSLQGYGELDDEAGGSAAQHGKIESQSLPKHIEAHGMKRARNTREDDGRQNKKLKDDNWKALPGFAQEQNMLNDVVPSDLYYQTYSEDAIEDSSL